MGQMILGGAGLAVGSLYGNPMLGFSLGMTLGGMLFPQNLGSSGVGRMLNINLQGASEGTVIPKVWGVERLAGTCIWTTSVNETYDDDTGGGSGGPSYTTRFYHYHTSLAILVCEGPIVSYRRIWANQTVIVDSRSGSDVWDRGVLPVDVRRYIGTSTQPADSYMQSLLGVHATPGYRNFAYTVFEKFSLDPYGGAVPTFTFEVDGGTCNPQIISEWTADQCGLISTEYNFSAISGISMRGFILISQQPGRDFLNSLSLPLFYDNIEVDGELKGVKRGGASIMTLDAGFMGAVIGKKSSGETVNSVRVQEVELPLSVTVNYQSELADFNTYSQQARRITRHSQTNTTVSLNMIVSDNQARQIAEVLLYVQWIERMQYTCITGWLYMILSPGDIVMLPTSAGLRRVRVNSIDAALWGPIRFSFIADDQHVYTQTVDGASNPLGQTGVNSNALPTCYVNDINAVSDRQALASHFILSAACGTTRVSWPGAQVYTDQAVKLAGFAGDGYTANPWPLMKFNVPGVVGVTTTLLSDHSGSVWDLTSTVTIQLFSGKLSSAAQLDVLNGLNMCVIGFEILQFTTATPLGSGLYTLSGLIRGRRGTEYATNSHFIGESFALVDNSCQVTELNLDQRGRTIGYRALDISGQYSILPAFTNITLVGRSHMTYAPVQPAGSRNPGHDLTMTWIRRVRSNGELVDNYDAPLDEPTERYLVDICSDSSYGVTVNTYGASPNLISSPAFIYTFAMQVHDFGSAQSTVYAIIYQFSNVSGQGFGLKVAL